MSGIVGWVAYDRDLPSQGTVLRTMVCSRQSRDPDAEYIWLVQHVWRDERQLAVFHNPSELQLVCVRVDRRDAATVACDGRIENHDELLSAMSSRAHPLT